MPLRYTPTRLWGYSGHVQTIIGGVISLFRCPLLNGKRFALRASDGATVTYDLYQPLDKHQNDGTSFNIFSISNLKLGLNLPNFGFMQELIFLFYLEHSRWYYSNTCSWDLQLEWISLHSKSCLPRTISRISCSSFKPRWSFKMRSTYFTSNFQLWYTIMVLHKTNLFQIISL